MAYPTSVVRYIPDGYGQLELNQCAFRRDGRIEAQCKLTDDFKKTGSGTTGSGPAENGMILAVNNVSRTITRPTGGVTEILALNYTTEHMYDERANALKDFYLVPGTFLPRLGYLSVGDKFTTNCICYTTDTTDANGFANDKAVEDYDISGTTGTIYGVASPNGAIYLVKDYSSIATQGLFDKVILRAVQKTTMPDGQFAFKFQVIKAD